MELMPGQLWWDEHRLGDGDSVHIVYLILSADYHEDLYFYKCAEFMWGDPGYMGASERYFLGDEIHDRLTYVGDIKQIKNFKRGNHEPNKQAEKEDPEGNP
jgi:hypothetical protein